MDPLVSICIVHYGRDEFLSRCIASIKSSTYNNIELIIINNNVSNDFQSAVYERRPTNIQLRYKKNKKNVGFAEGCNQGIESAKGKYIFFLNNDIEIDDDCISSLVEFAENNPEIGILQPKMLDFVDRKNFHSSAAGGFIDVLGYPFARGRIFDTVERDQGQYNDVVEVFWACGAALFARIDVIVEVGLFDPDFFLYMEEIDLAWRVQLLGYKVVYNSSAKVYHIGCPNLGRKVFLRMYFDHRNSILMLIKNLSFANLLIFLPVRLGLELGTAIGSIASFRFFRGFAIFKAFGYLLTHSYTILNKRRHVQSKRRVKDSILLSKIYHGSVALNYFLGRVQKTTDLKGFQVTKFMSKGQR